jgi:glycerophosphoryl diester phosphodiesterase
VARSLADKDSDITSVKDFGAKGDGATDDTSAFLTAIALGKPLVPRGAYNLPANVNVGDLWAPGGVYFAGAGAARISDIRGPNLAGHHLQPELIAHRGFKGISPENTIPSLTRALTLGANAVEGDIQVSADGVVYLMHDLTVDRTTNGTGTVTALTSTYIDSLVVDADVGTLLAGAKVPRLSDYLAVAATLGVKLYLEIKAVRSPADYGLIVDTIEAAGMTERVVLNSFSSTAIVTIRETYSSRVAVALAGASFISNFDFEIDRIADYRGGLLWDKVDILARPQIIARANLRGVPLAVYTINTQEEIAPLQRLGVSKFICDFPMDIKGVY